MNYMKKLKMVAFVVLMVIVLLSINSMPVFAASDNPILDPDFWEPTTSGDDILSDKVGVILGVIQTIGIIVSVIVLMVLGIKYMLGSAEEKAINKKAMIPYLVGAFMVFSVSTIPNFIYQFTQSVFCEHKNIDKVSAIISVNVGKEQYHELCKICPDCGAYVTYSTARHDYVTNGFVDENSVRCRECDYTTSGNLDCSHNYVDGPFYQDIGDYALEYNVCQDCLGKVITGTLCEKHKLQGNKKTYKDISVEGGREQHEVYDECIRCGELILISTEKHEYKMEGFSDEDYKWYCLKCGFVLQNGEAGCEHTSLGNELLYESSEKGHIGYRKCLDCDGKVKEPGKTTTHTYIMDGFTDEDYKWYCKYCNYAPKTGDIDCEHTDLRTDEIKQIGDTYFVICNGCEGKVKIDPADILYPDN